ncbi:MAG: cupredoxin family copper-binding protein [Luteolibacter sp.]
MNPSESITDPLHSGSASSPRDGGQNAPASREKVLEGRTGRRASRVWFFGISGIALVLWGTMPVVAPRESSAQGDESAARETRAPVTVVVSIRSLQFSPGTLEVKQGDVVEWKNDDIVPHTATSASFDSGTILSGQSWRHTFKDAGDISYACTFHPQMKGTVIVRHRI